MSDQALDDSVKLIESDAYLASDDMFALHCYVCVAILSTCKE